MEEQRLSEADFLLCQTILSAVQICLSAVFLALFFHPFLTGKKKGKMAVTALIFTLLYAVKALTPVGGWTCMILVSALLMAVSGYLGMERKFTLLLVVLFFSVRNLCILSVQSINYFTSRHFVREGDAVEHIFRNAVWNSILVVVIQICLFCALLYAVYVQVSKCVKELHDKEFHRRELCYLLLTPVTGIFFVNIIFLMFIIVTEDQVLNLYDQYPVLAWIVPVTAFLLYAGILAAIASWRQLSRLQEEKKTYFVEEQQIHAIKERMLQVDQFYHGIRQMKHEMKNHLTNIQGLLANGRYDEMERYITKMDGSMKVLELSIRTGNAVTDVIINDKYREAGDQKIRFESDFRYPAFGGYDAYDIGIIIHNLLQNALEACVKMQSGKRYILISGRQKKKFYFIRVTNSFEGEVAFDKDSHLPRSTKTREVPLHGIGLSNVRREALKYMGDMDIKVKKNEFDVTVMLQQKNMEVM